jgi:hypothetical protein
MNTRLFQKTEKGAGPPGPEKGEPPATKPRALKGWRQPARAQNHYKRANRQAWSVIGLVCVEAALPQASWSWLRWLAATRGMAA